MLSSQLRLETRQSQQGLTHKELANRRMGDRGIWRVREDGKFPPWSSCNLGMISVFQPVHRQESTYNGWRERNSGRAWYWKDPEMPVSPLPRTHLRISISNLTASTATSYSRSMTMETIRSYEKENITQYLLVSIPKHHPLRVWEIPKGGV